MKILISALLLVSTLNVYASQTPITDAEVIEAAKNDSIALAAFEQASFDDCKTTVPLKPSAPFEHFQIQILCTDTTSHKPGVYLQITIEGQYLAPGAADVKKIEIQRAG